MMPGGGRARKEVDPLNLNDDCILEVVPRCQLLALSCLAA